MFLFILSFLGLLFSVWTYIQSLKKVQPAPLSDQLTIADFPPTPTVLPTLGFPSTPAVAQRTYSAVLTTSAGPITLNLYADRVPNTVANFVKLAKSGFYNNLIFHRVLSGFMIQGGDPKGDGSGGPGYTFADEPFTGEYTRGTLAMANAGPNTNGSQFFIMHANYSLPKNYVIFGSVTSGMDTVDKIATASVSANLMGEMSKPVNPVVIKKIEITEK